MSDLEDGEISASEIETAGVVEDDFGNRWTLPTSELGEEYNANYSPLHLPKTDPRFKYQFERTERLGQAISEDWAPVRRSEVGLALNAKNSNLKLADYGLRQEDNLDPIHQVGDLTCVKIPIQIAEARQRAAQREADRIYSAIEPVSKRVQNAKSSLRSNWEAVGQRVEEDVIHPRYVRR